jgi:hypothetical protein
LEPLHQAADDGPLGRGEGKSEGWRRALRAAGLGQETGVGRDAYNAAAVRELSKKKQD